MKVQTRSNWETMVVATFAIFFAFGTVVAQGEKSISERYGSRDPRTCADTKAPARGAISAALAQKYLNCQMEQVSGGSLYLVENLTVQVGGPVSYASIRGQRSLAEIDTSHSVYPIRGSLLRYQCQNRLTAARVATANCNTYNEPKATGYCYKTTFGDWRCYMNDPGNDPENTRYDVPPPKGENKAAGETIANNKSAGTNPKQTAGTKAQAAAVERDANGLVKPDFSELEKYFEIVRYEYAPLDGRFTMDLKAKQQTNIFKWFLNAYDADGVKISETSFNGNVVTPEIGEPTRIYSFAPNERDIKRVARIAFTTKLE